MANYLQGGIDFPVLESLAPIPIVDSNRTFSNRGANSMVTDGERYIYMINTNGSGSSYISRYDTFTDSWKILKMLSGMSGLNGEGSTSMNLMTYCKVTRKLYVIVNSYFYEYDTVQQIVRSLSAVATTPLCIIHTCSADHASANDNNIFAIFQSDTGVRNYSISGNTWTTKASGGVSSLSSGAKLFWRPGISADNLVIVTHSSFYNNYSISGNTFELSGASSLFSQENGTFTGFVAGSMTAYNNSFDSLYRITPYGTESTDGNSFYRARTIMKCNLSSIASGTATSGTSTTVTNAAASMETNYYSQKWIRITSGTGAGQSRVIKSNTETAFTVYIPFSVTPDSTSVYEVVTNLVDFGTATSGASTTITDTSKYWNTGAYNNMRVRIIAGTGSGQDRRVSSHTTTAITVDTAWSVTPDNTSVYEVYCNQFDTIATLPINDHVAAGTYTLNGVTAVTTGYNETMASLEIKGNQYVYIIRTGSTGEWYRFIDPKK